MKNRKGITLISLVITIIVLLILASIATYSGINVIKSSKFTAFTTELKIMQTQVNSIYQKYKDNDTIQIYETIYTGSEILKIGEELTEGSVIKEQSNKVFRQEESGIISQDGYRYWSSDLIKELGIEGVEQDFFVNVEKRSIVSYEGFEYEGTTYYTLEQMSDGLYNVEYENPNTEIPTFDVKTENIGTNKWKITISINEYSGYIKKWQVRYQLEGQDYWNTTEDLSFIIKSPGNYSIMIVNGDVESEIKNILIVSAPELKGEMQAITFSINGTETQVTNSNKTEWYSYEITTDDDMTDGGTTGGGNSKWANAKLNGNYYVWIPRYAYKIDNSVTYKSQSGTSNKIDVRFIGTDVTSSNVETKVGIGYIVHPAFTFGTQELSGFWVGKYETTGTTDAPTILPNEISLKNINVSTMFTTAQKLSTNNYDAHMMKNIEWGAVAYLTQSQYGRNGTEVSVNQCNKYYTGAGRGIGTDTSKLIYNAVYDWTKVTDEQKYNGTIGKLSSTTGNVYGVYDMSGGTYEYVMGFYGKDGVPTKGDTGFSTFPESKYYDLYTSTSADSSNIGDALYEVNNWNNDNAEFVGADKATFARGGNQKDTDKSGLFSFKKEKGQKNNEYGFRICLCAI